MERLLHRIVGSVNDRPRGRRLVRAYARLRGRPVVIVRG